MLMFFPGQGLAYEAESLVRRLAHGECEDAPGVDAPDIVVQVARLAQRDHITARRADVSARTDNPTHTPITAHNENVVMGMQHTFPRRSSGRAPLRRSRTLTASIGVRSAVWTAEIVCPAVQMMMRDTQHQAVGFVSVAWPVREQ